MNFEQILEVYMIAENTTFDPAIIIDLRYFFEAGQAKALKNALTVKDTRRYFKGHPNCPQINVRSNGHIHILSCDLDDKYFTSTTEAIHHIKGGKDEETKPT